MSLREGGRQGVCHCWVWPSRRLPITMSPNEFVMTERPVQTEKLRIKPDIRVWTWLPPELPVTGSR